MTEESEANQKGGRKSKFNMPPEGRKDTVNPFLTRPGTASNVLKLDPDVGIIYQDNNRKMDRESKLAMPQLNFDKLNSRKPPLEPAYKEAPKLPKPTTQQFHYTAQNFYNSDKLSMVSKGSKKKKKKKKKARQQEEEEDYENEYRGKEALFVQKKTTKSKGGRKKQSSSSDDSSSSSEEESEESGRRPLPKKQVNAMSRTHGGAGGFGNKQQFEMEKPPQRKKKTMKRV